MQIKNQNRKYETTPPLCLDQALLFREKQREGEQKKTTSPG